LSQASPALLCKAVCFQYEKKFIGLPRNSSHDRGTKITESDDGQAVGTVGIEIEPTLGR
jgi:hypothetical protein